MNITGFSVIQKCGYVGEICTFKIGLSLPIINSNLQAGPIPDFSDISQVLVHLDTVEF